MRYLLLLLIAFVPLGSHAEDRVLIFSYDALSISEKSNEIGGSITTPASVQQLFDKGWTVKHVSITGGEAGRWPYLAVFVLQSPLSAESPKPSPEGADIQSDRPKLSAAEAVYAKKRGRR